MINREINFVFLLTTILLLTGCDFFFFHEGKDNSDTQNDLRIIDSIISINPILKDTSVTNKRSTFVNWNETGQEIVSTSLLFNDLGLNDSNFSLPSDISGLRIIVGINLAGNKFSKLPLGIEYFKWHSVYMLNNHICNPDSLTSEYLDEVVVTSPTYGDIPRGGKNWRTTQRCTTSVAP